MICYVSQESQDSHDDGNDSSTSVSDTSESGADEKPKAAEFAGCNNLRLHLYLFCLSD